MKKLLCACCLALLCAALPLTAKAAELDMGKLTCAEFMKMGADETGMLYIWLDGYASHMTGNNVLNSSTIEQDLNTLMENCKKNPSMKLLDMFNS